MKKRDDEFLNVDGEKLTSTPSQSNRPRMVR